MDDNTAEDKICRHEAKYCTLKTKQHKARHDTTEKDD